MKKHQSRGKPPNKKGPPPILVAVILAMLIFLLLVTSTYVLTAEPGSQFSFSFLHLTESVKSTIDNILVSILISVFYPRSL